MRQQHSGPTRVAAGGKGGGEGTTGPIRAEPRRAPIRANPRQSGRRSAPTRANPGADPPPPAPPWQKRLTSCTFFRKNWDMAKE